MPGADEVRTVSPGDGWTEAGSAFQERGAPGLSRNLRQSPATVLDDGRTRGCGLASMPPDQADLQGGLLR